MKSPHLSKFLLLVCAVLFADAFNALAATEHWIGVPGVSATTNWSDANNWSSPQQTYYNQVQFLGTGTAANTSTNFTSCLDSATGPAQMPIWELDMTPTNGNYTTLIDPGITMTLAAGRGILQVGADILHGGAPASANATETVSFVGAGAAFSNTGTIYLCQGSPTGGDSHNITLDFSKLDLWQMSTGPSLYVACNNTRANASLYMAKTNVFDAIGTIQLCNQSSSNSVPCAIYLGYSNFVVLGNNNLYVGGTGNDAGALMEFNPAFLGGAAAPVADFLSTVSGSRIPNVYVCDENGTPYVTGSATANFSGGNIGMLVGNLQIATSGANAGATGTLTFDNGTINANTAIVGDQATSAASSGQSAVGVINLNTNASYGSNATLIVNNTLTLGAVTGTAASNTSGTININGGALSAYVISNGLGTNAIYVNDGAFSVLNSLASPANPLNTLTLTNSTISFGVTLSSTNAVNNLTTGGTNTIDIVSVGVLTNLPATIRLLQYAGNINGAGYNFVLGALPTLCQGYISNDTANSSIDLVLTSGPEGLTWTGTNSDNWDYSTLNWLAGSPVYYVDGDYVTFNDSSTNGTVNLTADFSPGGTTVSNNATTYDFVGSGEISTGALTKQGSGTLVLDNSGNNNSTGTTTISSGILQIGSNDDNGNLPYGPVVNNGILAFDQTKTATLDNSISGSGTIVEAASGQELQFYAPITFTGNVLATNNSIIQGGVTSAFGTGNGAVVIANGSTLDLDGAPVGNKTVIVSGTGVNGNGAIINTGGPIYDSGTVVTTNLTLAGDTYLNFQSRVDLGSSTGMTLSTGGNSYNLTLQFSGYDEWRDVKSDAALSNLDVLAGGTLGYAGSTTLGNPAASLIIESGAQLTFYNDDGYNATLDKQVVLVGGSIVQNGGGATVIGGPVILTNNGSSPYCEFNVGGTSLSLTNGLSGNAVLYKQTGTSPLIIAGNSPNFTGGVLLYAGTMTLDGSIQTGITNEAGTVLFGNGSASGVEDISGGLVAGTPTSAGTLTFGGLVLESPALLTNNLTSASTVGGGVNSLIQVNGDLTVNGNTIYINPLAPLANGSTYTLITYTGNLNGSFAGAATVQTSGYTLTLSNMTTTNPHQIQLVVSGGTPSNLRWTDASQNNQWDVDGSANWTNLTTHVSPDYFITLDNVLFDDSILTGPSGGTNVVIPSGATVIPTYMTNSSSSAAYTISGGGQISGVASLVKQGSSVLTITTTNTFTGNTTIAGGAVAVTADIQPTSSGIGSTNGTLYITNGSSLILDMAGNYPAGDAGFGYKPIIVSGAGYNTNGAIQILNNPLYSDSSTLGLGHNVTLLGNTTIGGNTRWDWGYPGYNSTLSTHGSNFNFVAIETGYSQWQALMIDSNLGNIDMYQNSAGLNTWAVSGMGASLGNPTNVLTLHSNVLMDIGHSTVGTDNGYAKVIHVLGGAEFEYSPSGGAGDYRVSSSLVLESNALVDFANGGGGNGTGTALSGTVTLNGLAQIEVADSSVTFSNVLLGAGGFDLNSGGSTLVLTATNTYTGTTEVDSGQQLALAGNGSIGGSATIDLVGGGTVTVSGRSDGTLTLQSGQTLEGVGTINGTLAADAGSTVSPGASASTGTLNVTNTAMLAGTTSMDVNANGSHDMLSAASITYGGTLVISNLSGTLTNGQTFQLFSASSGSYAGSFASVTPPPGPGLAWDTAQLAVNGSVSVVSGPAPVPSFTSITSSGGNVIISGTSDYSNETYYVLATTNLALPASNWTVISTNMFSPTGAFSFTNSIQTNMQGVFYELEIP